MAMLVLNVSRKQPKNGQEQEESCVEPCYDCGFVVFWGLSSFQVLATKDKQSMALACFQCNKYSSQYGRLPTCTSIGQRNRLLSIAAPFHDDPKP